MQTNLKIMKKVVKLPNVMLRVFWHLIENILFLEKSAAVFANGNFRIDNGKNRFTNI
jgi:hypothetical protein